MIQRYININYQKDVALQLLSLDHMDLPSRSLNTRAVRHQATVKLGWSSSLEVKLKVLTWKDLTLRNPLTGSNRKLIKTYWKWCGQQANTKLAGGFRIFRAELD